MGKLIGNVVLVAAGSVIFAGALLGLTVILVYVFAVVVVRRLRGTRRLGVPPQLLQG